MGHVFRKIELATRQPTASKLPTRVGCHITAIEPDAEFVQEAVARCNPYFGFDENELTLVSTTLGEALADGMVPPRLNTVMWNRAEPGIFFGEDEDIVGQVAKTREVIRLLVDRLVPGGSFVLTIGTGSDDKEREARLRLVACAFECLPELGMRIVSGYSTIYYGEQKDAYKLLFGSINFGAIGSVIAVKSNEVDLPLQLTSRSAVVL